MKLLRTLTIVALTGLVVAGTVVALWCASNGQQWLDRTVQERMYSAVDHATVTGYRFHMDSISTRFRDGDVAITGIHLTYDSTLKDSLRMGVYNYLFAAHARSITLRGLSIWRLMVQREIHMRSIEVDEPVLDYTVHDRRVRLDAPFGRLRDPDARPPDLFAIGRITVRNAEATMQDLSGRLPVIHASGVGIMVDAVRVTHAGGRRRADLHMGDVDITLDSLSTTISGGYRLRCGAVHFSDRSERGIIERLVLTHIVDTMKIVRSTVLNMSVDSVVFARPDIGGLVADQALHMHAMELHGLHLDATLDKTFPTAPPVQRILPPAALMALPFPIRIDTLRIVESDIRYHERSDATLQWASIAFTRTSGLFIGIDNSADQGPNPMIIGDLSLQFMDTARMTVHYEADLGTTDFTFNTRVDDLPFSVLNEVTTGLLRLSLEGGTLQHLHLSMKGNERKARCIMDLTYSELTATVASSASVAQRHSMFGSVLDHMMATDKGGGLSDQRRRTYTVDRDPERSLLTFIWHSTRQGLSRNLLPGVKQRIGTLLRTQKKRRRQEQKKR